MMTDEPKRVKGGRPRRHSPDAKRPTMSFRIGSALHAKLIVAAAQNERSLSEQIERMLEAAFEQADTRTIIREELARAEEQKREALMAHVTIGSNGSLSASAANQQNYGPNLALIGKASQ